MGGGVERTTIWVTVSRGRRRRGGTAPSALVGGAVGGGASRPCGRVFSLALAIYEARAARVALHEALSPHGRTPQGGKEEQKENGTATA